MLSFKFQTGGTSKLLLFVELTLYINYTKGCVSTTAVGNDFPLKVSVSKHISSYT